MIGNKLRRMAPQLRFDGISIRFEQRRDARTGVLRLEPIRRAVREPTRQTHDKGATVTRVPITQPSHPKCLSTSYLHHGLTLATLFADYAGVTPQNCI
jgi:hypothetical protein